MDSKQKIKMLDLLYDFKTELMEEFIVKCGGNDYNKLTLLIIGETIESMFDKYVEKIQ